LSFASRLLGFRVGGSAALLAASVSLVIAAPSCEDEVAISESDASFDSAVLPPAPDAASVQDAPDAGSPATTTFRLAHLSPDVGRIDVCYRTSPSDAFNGPLIAATGTPDASASIDATTSADAGDAGDAGPERAGLSFPNVTPWFTVQTSGAFEIAVVSAADGSCSTPRARQRITLDPGKRSTVALLGLFGADAGASTSLDIVAFTDDITPAPGAARTRFIHAALGTPKVAPAPSYAVKAVDGPTIVSLTARVEPKKASSPTTVDPAIDTLGYHAGQPLALGSIHLEGLNVATIDAGPALWSSTVHTLDMSASSTHTGFLVSEPSGKVAILWCNDTTASPSCALLRP
jgi:hypothetical protein